MIIEIKMDKKLNMTILTEIGIFSNKIRKEALNNFLESKYTSMSQVIEDIEGKIFRQGYIPAFPCAVSINDVAAHYTFFEENYTFEKGDIIKVDFGVSKEGFCTDCAFTVEYKSEKHKRLINANREALERQLELVDYGVPMKKLGEVAESVAKREGFRTIHELSGHQIGQNNLHCGMSVPNYENNDKRGVVENIELAIEPYFTLGTHRIKNSFASNILHLQNIRNVRDPFARKVLNYVKDNYPHLPFSKRWLVKEFMEKIYPETNTPFSKNELLIGLRSLQKEGIVYEYPTLVSRDGSINTQFEETVVFLDNKKTIITRL